MEQERFKRENPGMKRARGLPGGLGRGEHVAPEVVADRVHDRPRAAHQDVPLPGSDLPRGRDRHPEVDEDLVLSCDHPQRVG